MRLRTKFLLSITLTCRNTCSLPSHLSDQMKNLILLSYGLVDIKNASQDHHSDIQQEIDPSHKTNIATLLSNLAYYGYIPDSKLLSSLYAMNSTQLTDWWQIWQVELDAITANDKNMDQFVVYRNFPTEVLDLSETDYWINQIWIYLGVASHLIVEIEKERPPLNDQFSKLKNLSIAPQDILETINLNLQSQPSKWTDSQSQHAAYLAKFLSTKIIVLKDFAFKENGINLISQLLKENLDHFEFKIEDATDILRLISLISGGKADLKTHFQFCKMGRNARRFWLNLLENTKHLEDDLALRPRLWKRFLKHLHPGDFKNHFPKVIQAYDLLYRNELKSFHQKIQKLIDSKEIEVFKLLASRPGEFFRRVHALYSVFGDQIIDPLTPVLHRLSTLQLLKLSRYVRSINDRKFLLYPPKGNWQKLVKVHQQKIHFSQIDLKKITETCDSIVAERLKTKYPNGVTLSPNLAAFEQVKIPGNVQELASYGKGTAFPIPQHIKFIRVASYWQLKTNHSIWFDNSINAFDQDWQARGVCCWNHPQIGDTSEDQTSSIKGAIFSGDPVNLNELKGRACQMIDLYIDELKNLNVRYLVWSLLSYNSIPFEKADEVLATLQWGETAETGKHYEPSRAQMVFKVGGKNLVKYVAYIDLLKRELVYLDANLKAKIRSASENSVFLSEYMPAMVEYLDGLPSYGDYFKGVVCEGGEVIDVDGCLRGNLKLEH